MSQTTETATDSPSGPTPCSADERHPLSWIVPVIECDDLELTTISALCGVMQIFNSRRPADAPQDQETVRRIVCWFADKYGGIKIR